MQPVRPVTSIIDLPAIQAGRSLAAILNVSPSQIMPALYQEELSRRLATICKEIEECFEGNRCGKAYKKIADIAGTSQGHHPGLSGTPSEVKRAWELHFTHLFRQEDDGPGPQSASEIHPNLRTVTGTHGEESVQITHSDSERGRTSPRPTRVAGGTVEGTPPTDHLGRFDATISGGPPVVATAPEQGDPVANINDPSYDPNEDFTEEELDLALSTSQASSSPGLDGLPYAVFKLPVVRVLLLSICNNVLRSGIAPPDWLNSAIVPLFKKGNQDLPDNYRGIALMSTAAKLFNKMILKRIRDLVDTKLRSNQNGFRQHRSCA